ncbi:hypothetical protein M9Y10_022058 [Tritrichomonas musculus]|uniref:Serine/threonine-protein phosphatase n=1 Tax=Tritrichomonas musculus TaxID=1915356 RepID=A0ABR2KR71_9EUKA
MKASYSIADFPNNITSIVKTLQLMVQGYRFYCEIEITSDKLLNFYFHPLIRSFEFDLIVNIKNASDGSTGDSINEHLSVDLDLTNTFEFASAKPIEDDWLNPDKSLTIEFEIVPSETDYSSQLDYIFEVLYSQIEGEDGLDEYAIQWMLGVCERIFLSEPTVLRTNAPCVIVGDLHGQFYDVMRIFKDEGTPDDGKKYLFLGDYVDRGYNSLSTFLLLLAFKIKYPDRCLVIRGNHEAEDISSRYGFRDEILVKFGASLYNDFIPLFDSIPLAILVNEKIFCVHGGLSPKIKTLKEIEEISRPFNPVEGEGSFDLLWTDPSTDVEEYGPSPRGSSYVFGKKPTLEFLKTNNLTLIIRAHQMMMNGYGYNLGEDVGLLTVFSASHYTSDENKGAYVSLNDKCEVRIENYAPLTKEQEEEFKGYNFAEYLSK